MTNYEAIKKMAIDDMADFLNNVITFVSNYDEEPYISMFIGEAEKDVHHSFGDLVEFLKAEVE